MPGVTPAQQVLKLSGPPDVVAAVPFVVGFQPVESLVVIALHGPRQRILHTLRVDLSDVARARAEELTEAPCHPTAIAATLKRNGATGALVVILTESEQTDDDGDLPGRALAENLRAELERKRIPVRDSMLVKGGRWFSYLCSNPDCCPIEGTPVEGAAHDRVAAEMVLAGDAPLRGREEIEARVAADDSLRAAAVQAAMRALEAGDQDMVEDPFTVMRHAFKAIRADEPLEPQTVAQCLAWLPHYRVRDACLEPWEGEDGETALSLWCALTRLAPPGYVAAPACLVAFVALCRGAGALANSAIDRALADDPTYSFALLLLHIAGHGLPPKEMRRIAAMTSRDLGYGNVPGAPRAPLARFDGEWEEFEDHETG
jgi:hypothetical protein